jgi:hypothetical protein
MNYHVISLNIAVNGRSPYQVAEQATGRGVGWINRFLDRECVRRVANTTAGSLCTATLGSCCQSNYRQREGPLLVYQ